MKPKREKLDGWKEVKERWVQGAACDARDKAQAGAYSRARYALWEHLSDNHSLHCLESELDEIIRLALAVGEAGKEDGK